MVEHDGGTPAQTRGKEPQFDDIQPETSYDGDRASNAGNSQNDSATTTDSNDSLEKRPFDVEKDTESRTAPVTP